MQERPNWRKRLFTAGVIMCVLAAAGTLGCWQNPFPLLALPDGGYKTNPLDERLPVASLCSSLLTTALATFGRGAARVLFIVIGLLLFALSWSGYVGNNV